MRTPDAEPSDLADAFEDASAAFDRLHTLLWEPVSRASVLISQPRPGERVLDACCGTGASALPTARLVGPTGHVHGVDLAEKQIAAAARRARAGNLSWARFTVADATTLPPAAPDSDLVQCVLGIFFFPDLLTGTEHLIDQARPFGRATLTIWNRGAIELVGRLLLAAVLPLKPQLAQWAQAQKSAGINRINTAPAFTGWLGERGLKQVQVHTRPHAVSLTPTVAWDLVIGSGFRALLEGLDPAQVAQVRRSYLQELATHEITRIDATTLIGTGRITP